MSTIQAKNVNNELMRLYGEYDPHFDYAAVVDGYLNHFAFGSEQESSFIRSKLENLWDIVPNGVDSVQFSASERDLGHNYISPSSVEADLPLSLTVNSPLNQVLVNVSPSESEQAYNELLDDYRRLPRLVQATDK
jgi:hypothetical protein